MKLVKCWIDSKELDYFKENQIEARGASMAMEAFTFKKRDEDAECFIITAEQLEEIWIAAKTLDIAKDSIKDKYPALEDFIKEN